MKYVIVPHWMRAALVSANLPENTVLDKEKLKKLFSEKDLLKYTIMNTWGIRDILHPYYTPSCRYPSGLDLNKVLEPCENSMFGSSIPDSDMDMYAADNVRDVLMKYQDLLVGRTLVDGFKVRFNYTVLNSPYNYDTVLGFFAEVVDTKANGCTPNTNTVDPLIKALMENGTPIDTIAKSGLFGLLLF